MPLGRNPAVYIKTSTCFTSIRFYAKAPFPSTHSSSKIPRLSALNKHQCRFLSAKNELIVS
eukprot:IDg4883t1